MLFLLINTILGVLEEKNLLCIPLHLHHRTNDGVMEMVHVIGVEVKAVTEFKEME